MVLMNGSTRARNAASLINQTNTFGGVKKQGLPPTIGLPASVAGVYRFRLGCPCPSAKLIVSKTVSCGTNIGAKTVKPRC